MFEEFKLKNKCKKEGKMAEYEEYKQHLKCLKRDINMYEGFLRDATEKFTNIWKIYTKDSKQYVDAKDEVLRWKYTLEERRLQLKFIRPNLKQDIDYRNNQYDKFTSRLSQVLPSNLDLRFHGTPIYFAEQIIKSGTITSSADRYDGYIRSTDRKGEISVSSIETLDTTIHGWFTDLTAYERCLPAGCLFVVLPKDKEDAEYGHNILHSIDFRKNPEQLYGVVTTPENIEQVKSWMAEAKFNANSVYTFEEFLQNIKEKSTELTGKLSREIVWKKIIV